MLHRGAAMTASKELQGKALALVSVRSHGVKVSA